MIVANNVCKSYNRRTVAALNDVSLEIADGEFSVILGASGSGKSTLLSVLSGLEKSDGGRIECCGQVISDMTEKQLTEFRRQYVGFVFQHYYLLGHLSVESNVRLGADLANNGDYTEVIKAVGLSDKIKCKPNELSGGEQQRVCIARAIAKNPKILFLDEPTGALDESIGRAVLDYISRLKSERGFTVVMVTHNANIADMADRVIGMNSGKIVSDKTNPDKKTAYEIGW